MASFNPAGTLFQIQAGQDGAAAGDYFNGNRPAIRSLTMIGSTDRTDFTLTETAAGVVRFPGNSPTLFRGNPTGGHSNAANLPAGTYTVHNVSVNVKGTGNDTLSMKLSALHNIDFFADNVELKSGNIHIANDSLNSFSGLAELTFHGASGKFTADASLVNATTITIADDLTANNRLSQVSGNGGFTRTRFGGFDELIVRGGTGSETMTVGALDALDAALKKLTISGDNVFGTDPAADTINVTALAAGRMARLIGAQGNDLFNVVPGVIEVQAGPGSNRLVVDTTANVAGQNITMTNNRIMGGANFDIIYTAVGGSYQNGVVLTTGVGIDNVRVQSTAGPMTIQTNGGNDVIIVAPVAGGLANALVGALHVNGGLGSNVLAVAEASSTQANVIEVTATRLAGIGFVINYNATGGSFAQVAFTAGQGSDLIRYLSKGAGQMILNAGGGNDSFFVQLTSAISPAGLQIDGGTGANQMTIQDVSGGAVIRNVPSGVGQGTILVRYGVAPIAAYAYRNIAQVAGINVAGNYVQALFHNIIGRNATAQEQTFFTNLLNRQGRLAVVRALEMSVEGRNNLVRKWYLLFAGRRPTANEAAPLVQALLAGQSEESVLGRLLGNANAPRTAAIRTRLVTFSYQALLRRAPTAAERTSWSTASARWATFACSWKWGRSSSATGGESSGTEEGPVSRKRGSRRTAGLTRSGVAWAS
jgi:hypothetical protein